jgi:Holliday junction resolvase-like predicted endonuclease
LNNRPTSSQTEDALRAYLAAQGYTLSQRLSNGFTGVDILATRGNEQIYVEVIGHKGNASHRSRVFFESFFRAVSRQPQQDDRIVAIAMPSKSAESVPRRARVCGTAWNSIGNAFKNLEIWAVKVSDGSFTRKKWNEWK